MLIDHEYHIVELNYITDDVWDWLFSLGPPTGTRWWFKNNKIYFADQQDHLMFLLSCTQ